MDKLPAEIANPDRFLREKTRLADREYKEDSRVVHDERDLRVQRANRVMNQAIKDADREASARRAQIRQENRDEIARAEEAAEKKLAPLLKARASTTKPYREQAKKNRNAHREREVAIHNKHHPEEPWT